MSETLTFDNTPETEVLTSEEQDSLEVGQELKAQQEGLLAGKYANAEELEKAYIELQGKLGSKDDEPAEPEAAQEETEPEVEEQPESNADSDLFDKMWEEATTNQKYSKESLDKLEKMSPRDLAQMHMAYRANQPASIPLTDQTVNELKGVAGGDQGYDTMIGWAKNNLQEQEIAMYDRVMDMGDPVACFFAVQALKYRFDDASGVEGQMLTGKAPSNSGDQFKSQQQVVDAMSDPKYDTDPAYRKEVAQKLERSNVRFSA